MLRIAMTLFAHEILTIRLIKLCGSSKYVIPAKAGIQNPWTSLDSGVRRSDEMIILRGCLWKYYRRIDALVPQN
jgi:hypothetical protein